MAGGSAVTIGPSMSDEPNSRLRFWWRVTAVHVSTYMVAGVLAMTLFDYEGWWATERLSFLRPMDSSWVRAGPALQVVRGLLLALVLWPIRERVLEGPRGWLVLWGLLAGVGILGTYAAPPGSLEGVIYTDLPLAYHVFGLPEIYLQSLAFSVCLVGWYRRPHKAWGWVFGIGTGATVLLSGGGTLAAMLAG